MPLAGQDRLGMELDAVDRQGSMPQAHQRSVIGVRGRFERVYEGGKNIPAETNAADWLRG